jgi:hypothetical protein
MDVKEDILVVAAFERELDTPTSGMQIYCGNIAYVLESHLSISERTYISPCLSCFISVCLRP